MSPTEHQRSVAAIHPPGLLDQRKYYNHVMLTTAESQIITTAGQVGRDIHGVYFTNPEEQIAQAFANLKRCLEAAGADVGDVMKLTYYIVDYDPKHRRHLAALDEFLGPHRPAATLIPVPALASPECIFEVEAIAAIPLKSAKL